MKFSFILLSFLVCPPLYGEDVPLATSPSTETAIAAFHDKRYLESMGEFIAVLDKDPANAQARTYINLIAREMQGQRNAAVREERLAMLSDSARRLENSQKTSLALQSAIEDTTLAESRIKEDRWQTWCDRAYVELKNGHYLAANYLVFRVLSENSSFAEGQRVLSELQSEIRTILDNNVTLSSMERYALEGFYAYGQADYPSAATSWNKARMLAGTGLIASAPKRVVAYFEPYERVAQGVVNEKKQQAEFQALFDQGQALFAQGRYTAALDTFRKLAIVSPEFPQLAQSLIRAEGAEEQDRARRLGQKKQHQLDTAYESGMKALQNSRYAEAKTAFEEVLKIEPTHSQARTYLAMAIGELHRQFDPKAAQQHYEAGLIAYASGKLEDALREWRIATRMNPQHQKAHVALGKVQKELALYKEEP